MNEYGVLTTAAEIAAFPKSEYPFIDSEGTFNVTLISKYWGEHINIICAFETDTGEKFRASVFRRSKDELYAPGKSEIDFSKVPTGTHLACTFAFNSKGRIKMTDAAYCC